MPPRLVAALAGAAVLAGLVVAWPYLRPRDVPSATPAAPPVAAPAAPEPPAAAVQEFTVAINAVPWAHVRIVAADGPAPPIERTTPFSVALPAGNYRLEFQHPAFGKATRTLAVRPGESPSINQVMPAANVDRIVSDVLGEK